MLEAVGNFPEKSLLKDQYFATIYRVIGTYSGNYRKVAELLENQSETVLINVISAIELNDRINSNAALLNKVMEFSSVKNTVGEKSLYFQIRALSLSSIADTEKEKIIQNLKKLEAQKVWGDKLKKKLIFYDKWNLINNEE